MLLLSVSTTACDGSDVFWPWFLWLLGAFILGAILGWLLKRCNCPETVAAPIASTPTVAPVAVAAAPAVAIDAVKDDLTKIEGIGPKIKGLLNDDGIWSFAQLAAAPLSQLQKILDNAGPRYRVHNPKTWAQQSKMAHEGKWTELKKWQDELDGGL